VDIVYFFLLDVVLVGQLLLLVLKLLQPSIFSRSDNLPSLIGYGDVRVKKLSNPLLISCHAFSTRGRNGRPRGPDMRGLQSVDEVIVTAYEHLDVMSRRDVSAFWTCISKLMTKRQPRQRSHSSNREKLSRKDTRHMLQKIFDDTTNGIDHCSMRELTETILGIAKTVKILREQRKKREEDSSIAILRELLLNKDMKPNEEFFYLFASASIDKLHQFNARCLSNLAYAYGLIEYVPEFDDGSDLFDHIATQSLVKTNEFNAQDISNMLWAYATVKKPHLALFAAMGDQVVSFKDLEEFKPQALSNIVWAYASAGICHLKLFEKVATHIVGLNSLDRFTHPQDVSNTVWAYATAGIHHPKLLGKVASHIVESDRLDKFKPRDLKDVVWAYATAQLSHPKLFREVARAAIQRKEEFNNSQHVANLLWAFATMGIIDKKLFLSFVPTAAKLINSCDNQHLINIAWAYAVADVDAPTLFNDVFVKKCVEKKDGFVNEDLFQLHQWHLWQTKENSNPGLPLELQNRCYNTFISANPTPSKLQADVVAQLTSIGFEPKEEVLMDSGYRIDAVVDVNGKSVGVEVDGPYHFIGKGRSLH
jgi:hypothetical protein